MWYTFVIPSNKSLFRAGTKMNPHSKNIFQKLTENVDRFVKIKFEIEDPSSKA